MGIRSFILDHPTSNVVKWCGKSGWTLQQATNIVENLATLPISRVSISTAWNDGKNPKYQKGLPDFSPAQLLELERAKDKVAESQQRHAFDKLVGADLTALQKRIEALEAKTPVQREIVVKINDRPGVTLKESTHPIFEQVLFHITCGDNVMLVGPSGCGKTHIAEQLAKALKRRHDALSLSGGVTESKIFGRVTPNITTGKQEFHGAPFSDFYENGGLFLLDEVDAADPNVLLSLNRALGNRVLTLDRPKDPNVKQHADFICLAAANTWGNGADRQFVGRNQQDGAFFARFVQLAMDYDEDLERRLCPGQPMLVSRLQRYRANVRKNRLERTVSTRFLTWAYRWMNNGKDLSYVDQMLFAGWRKDEIEKARG